MQAGKLVEQGTHEALLKQGGLYKELYTLQKATADLAE
jgi:ABC-type multidrug transport system fused ATPase/permease subunit